MYVSVGPSLNSHYMYSCICNKLKTCLCYLPLIPISSYFSLLKNKNSRRQDSIRVLCFQSILVLDLTKINTCQNMQIYTKDSCIDVFCNPLGAFLIFQEKCFLVKRENDVPSHLGQQGMQNRIQRIFVSQSVAKCCSF